MSQSVLGNAPAIFNFNSHTVRVVLRDGEPWFVATDVCAALGYANSRKAVADHLDEDERGVTTGYTLGGDQRLIIISESGLYALVLRSRKPEARKFAKWVTSEVLPTIRKTGSYHVSESFDPMASSTEAVKFASDYVWNLHRHIEDPSKHPEPEWNENEVGRIAHGLVSAWMLRHSRWLLSFGGDDGKPVLTPVPKDACVMSVERLLEAINEPGGIHVAPEKLFRFVQATLGRLERGYEYQRNKAAGKPATLHW